jgi:hypothetical protein
MKKRVVNILKKKLGFENLRNLIIKDKNGNSLGKIRVTNC